MAIIISVGNNKGGVTKSTTSAIISYLLAKDSRVLAVDCDSQGDLSYMLSGQEDFSGRTLYEACRDRHPAPYIFTINDRLHLLPANFELGEFKYLLGAEDKVSRLKETLDKIQDQYDYIILDQPPHLEEIVANSLFASDFTIVPILAEPFSVKKLETYVPFIHAMRELNPKLTLAGILLTVFDPRASIDRHIRKELYSNYPEMMFKTVIHKKIRIKEFSHFGIQESRKADRQALQPYVDFVKELKTVVQKH